MSDILNKLDKKIKKAQDKYKLYTASELVDRFVDQYTDKREPIRFGINAFDDLFDGNLRGQLGAYVGYGGTKKSLFALNNANYNSNISETKTVYSTMEMPAVRLLHRMIDYSTDPQYENEYEAELLRGTDLLKKEIKAGYQQEVRKVLKEELDKYYGRRLLISEQTRMTVDDYRKLLDREKPDILVVDGLSRMGGQGTETEMYSNNSGDLKDLVNEYECFGILICHCSKGAELTTRDLRRFVRGSEKILDNCDFVMNFSLCETDSGDYDEKYGWIRLVDKRNTGKIIDQIYEFDKLRLMMKDCHLEPQSFETKKKTGFIH